MTVKMTKRLLFILVFVLFSGYTAVMGYGQDTPRQPALIEDRASQQSQGTQDNAQGQTLSTEDMRKALFEYILHNDDPMAIRRLHQLIMTIYEIQGHYVDSKNTTEILDLAIQGMMRNLDPNNGIYIGPKTDKADKVVPMPEDSFYGLGISFALVNGKFFIIRVYDNSPASEVGIKTGDILHTVNGQSVDGLSAIEVSKLIKSHDDSKVVIGITDSNGKHERELTLTLRNVDNAPIEYKDLPGDIAYIRLYVFSKSTDKYFVEALKKSSGKKALIIDLRDNPGGYMGSVVNVLGRMLGPNNVALVAVGKNGVAEPIPTEGEKSVYPNKLVVLTNLNSASASEIMAGDLQSLGQAKVIGIRTHGKNTIQTDIGLGQSNTYGDEVVGIHLTIGRYFLPGGQDVAKDGITPDIKIDQLCDFKPYEYLTKRDAQFNRALKFIRTGR